MCVAVRFEMNLRFFVPEAFQAVFTCTCFRDLQAGNSRKRNLLQWFAANRYVQW